MEFATGAITFIYYALVAWVSIVLVRNLIRCRHWEKELLYVVVLLPFLLRLLLLK
jgi:hypothetical protein